MLAKFPHLEKGGSPGEKADYFAFMPEYLGAIVPVSARVVCV